MIDLGDRILLEYTNEDNLILWTIGDFLNRSACDDSSSSLTGRTMAGLRTLRGASGRIVMGGSSWRNRGG